MITLDNIYLNKFILIAITFKENLPPKMDHKRLDQALSKYGTILHVSLPRFKNNKELKGFGFIEFKTVDGARRALKV